MSELHRRHFLARGMSEYGMLLVLFGICVYFSAVTIDWQEPAGETGGRQLAGRILQQYGAGTPVLIVARNNQQDVEFADAAAARLREAGLEVLDTVKGEPADARAALERAVRSGQRIPVICCNQATVKWGVLEGLDQRFPSLGPVEIVTPERYRWPSFLMADNLLNVTGQIVEIAILAIGMTMVILTGGIDLSVGSLIALAAVVATALVRDLAGAQSATAFGMTCCCLAGILACGLIGLFSGVVITWFQMPPFIVTLAMMLVARGLAYLVAAGESIAQVPAGFAWLGGGTDLAGLPNKVVLMVVLYAGAHLVMTRTPLGRYIYATGGNAEAARLSGVRVNRILLFVYTVCGLLAGLGGIVMASRLKSGSPTYGDMYELYTIAAVVVGGTSLSGGQGNVLGTLIGALIIGVIQNGMNLTGVGSHTQKVVLGLVLLGAVLIDMLRRRGWRGRFPFTGRSRTT